MKSLFEVCVALQARRLERARGDAPLSLAVLSDLVDAEDFETLLRAKHALKNGYFSFLTNLCTICWWLYRESEKPSHLTDLTKRQIHDIDTKHSKELKKIEDELAAQFTEVELNYSRKRWEENEKFQKQWKEERGISHRVRNTRNDTDLPTLGMIQEIHRSIFPNQNKFWKGHPKDISAIWRDAGLSWLPQDRGAKHPFLPERIDTLKVFLKTHSDH